MLGAGQSQWLAFRKKTKKHTNQNKTPVVSRDRHFVLLCCISQQQQQQHPPATGCVQRYFPRGLLYFVVVLRILLQWGALTSARA